MHVTDDSVSKKLKRAPVFVWTQKLSRVLQEMDNYQGQCLLSANHTFSLTTKYSFT